MASQEKGDCITVRNWGQLPVREQQEGIVMTIGHRYGQDDNGPNWYVAACVNRYLSLTTESV